MATFKAKDGTQIYYKDCGAGKPVLFSHGWPLDGDMWDSQLNYLAERGFRAIAFDRRGFGRSDQPWNGYDYDTFASDINDLITTLDLRRDAGGLLHGRRRRDPLHQQLRQRARGRSGAAGRGHADLRQIRLFPQGVDQSVFDGIRDGLRKDRAQFISDFATPFYGTNAGQTVSAGALTQTLNIALLASLKGTIDCVTAFGETDFRPDMAKIDVPTLVIHGSNDQIVPFESTGKLAAEMIKNATLKVYDNAPHGFALTHQDQLNEDLLAFVKSL
jgi:pimeloyl-ACP methyl ester carboxylesterase